LADEPTGNLDSKNSANIMELLKDLNDQGNTLVMVTHDHDVAAYAHKVIHMSDGQIVETRRNRKTAIKTAKPKRTTLKVRKV
jgi:ABC-type lipoprotein export system ATPase subunit